MKSIHPLKMSHSTIQETIVNKLRACAEQVFDELGPDYSEATYQNAFEVECQLRKIHFVRQPTLNILYKGNIVGFQRPDMIVENEVVIEMKACREMNAGSRHLQNWESQLRNYLKNNHMCGLLIIFGTQHAKCKFIQNSEQRPNKKSKVCKSTCHQSQEHLLEMQNPPMLEMQNPPMLEMQNPLLLQPQEPSLLQPQEEQHSKHQHSKHQQSKHQQSTDNSGEFTVKITRSHMRTSVFDKLCEIK